MDNFKGSTLGRRSLRIANGISSNLPMKPLGVSNSQSSYERKTDLYSSLQKSPINVRKSLFESNAKENSDYALGKEFSSIRGSTGTSPVVVNMKNTNDSQEKKTIKPRKSMLGLRSKTNLSNFTKDGTTVTKPLISSPNHERLDSYNLGDMNLKPLYRKSISTPQLSPFDSDDIDTSAFFNKGISDSTWSVFKKVKQKSTYEAPVTRGSLMSGKARQLRQSLASSLDQEVKLKWLSQTFQKEGNNPVKRNTTEKSTDEYSRESGISTDHEDDDCSHNKSDKNIDQSSKECISPIQTIDNTEELDESSNSMDSYILNETIIVNRGKNNLEMIEEEGVNRDSLCGESNNNVNDTIHEVTDSARNLTLFEDLMNEKEAMDSKWLAFIKQREIFEKKWNDFASVMGTHKENSNITKKNPRQVKKVICTKVRKSIALSPRVCTKSSKTSSSKTCAEGKTNMSSCKTPISTDGRLKMLRKSLCYTPNTLSRKVDDQAKDIFGEI